MIKRNTYKTKEQLTEENWKLRQLLYELYMKKAKAIYVINNGDLHEDLDDNIRNSFESWCKYNGI